MAVFYFRKRTMFAQLRTVGARHRKSVIRFSIKCDYWANLYASYSNHIERSRTASSQKISKGKLITYYFLLFMDLGRVCTTVRWTRMNGYVFAVCAHPHMNEGFGALCYIFVVGSTQQITCSNTTTKSAPIRLAYFANTSQVLRTRFNWSSIQCNS